MAEFQILQAAKKGFIRTWNDRKILFKKSIPAYVIHVISFFFIARVVSFVVDENQQMKMEIVNGWELYLSVALLFLGMALLSYVFIYQSRLILLNEHEIPAEENKRKSVIRTYSYAIAFFLGFLLFKELLNRGVGAITGLLEGTHSTILIGFGLLNAVLSLWLLRFGVAHIPLAIDFPIRDFLKKVRGFKFSFHLLGLLIVTVVPISFASLIVMALVVEAAQLFSETYLNYPVVLFAAFFYVTGFLIVNNASIYALDEVMKKPAEDNV